MQLTHTEIEGFAAITVDTGPLTLTLIPALGGKIASLRDTRSGREWLWRHPRLPYRRLPHGSSYMPADTGGWDECFPSVSACTYPTAPWEGAAIQDHGELWSQSAECQAVERADSISLVTRWRGVALPYVLTRTLTLNAGSAGVRVEYLATNPASAPIDFVWCVHPLIAIEPGMRLETPAAARFHCNGTTPADALPTARDLTFPLTLTKPGGVTVDLSTLPGPEAAVAIKLWSAPLTEGWARMRAADGALRMRWDPADLPQLALWINLGAWAGDGGAPYYNLGLEPCIGAQDSLEDAVRIFRCFATLPPGGQRAWAYDLELEA